MEEIYRRERKGKRRTRPTKCKCKKEPIVGEVGHSVYNGGYVRISGYKGPIISFPLVASWDR